MNTRSQISGLKSNEELITNDQGTQGIKVQANTLLACEEKLITSVFGRLTLSKLRQFSGESYQHRKVYIKYTDPGKKNSRKKCALCAKGNHKYHQTNNMCSSCDVLLCARARTKIDNDNTDTRFQW